MVSHAHKGQRAVVGVHRQVPAGELSHHPEVAGGPPPRLRGTTALTPETTQPRKDASPRC
ncbi:hypothetical protein RSPPQCQH_CDS0062 [Mycolicibacterium phage phi1_186001]